MKKLSIILVSVLLPLQLFSFPVSFQIHTKREGETLKKIGIIGEIHVHARNAEYINDDIYIKTFYETAKKLQDQSQVNTFIEVSSSVSEAPKEELEFTLRLFCSFMKHITFFSLVDLNQTKPFRCIPADLRPQILSDINPLVHKVLSNQERRKEDKNPRFKIPLKSFQKTTKKAFDELQELIKTTDNPEAFFPISKPLKQILDTFTQYNAYMETTIEELYFLNLQKFYPLFHTLQILTFIIADIYFLKQILKDQIENNLTMLICGEAHALAVGKIIENLGYTSSTRVGLFENSIDYDFLIANRRHPKELAAFFTNFFGICNYCYQPTRSRCTHCKQARYCNSKCRENDRKNHACFCDGI